MYSLDGEFEKEFSRMKDIKNYFLENFNQKVADSHIYAVCNGKRKSSYRKDMERKSRIISTLYAVVG